MPITHQKVALTPDDGTSEVGSDEWNAAHVITGHLVPAYGELYEVNETGSSVTITTGGSPSGTFYPWTTSTAGLVDPSGNVTADTANDRLVVGSSGSGVYRVAASVSFNATQEREYQLAVHLNGTRVDKLRTDIWFKTEGNDTGGGISGLVQLAAGDYLDLRFSASLSASTITLKHVNLSAVRVA